MIASFVFVLLGGAGFGIGAGRSKEVVRKGLCVGVLHNENGQGLHYLSKRQIQYNIILIATSSHAQAEPMQA
jgi:hypothetical protein